MPGVVRSGISSIVSIRIAPHPGEGAHPVQKCGAFGTLFFGLAAVAPKFHPGQQGGARPCQAHIKEIHVIGKLLVSSHVHVYFGRNSSGTNKTKRPTALSS
ncbi:MAG: hypothetical protein ACOX5Z_05155 [Desulfobulbus sp.]|jgi:hypothetical protein